MAGKLLKMLCICLKGFACQFDMVLTDEKVRFDVCFGFI